MHGAVGQLGAVDRFVLLLLGAGGGEPVPGPVHLQNGMYMLSKAFPDLADDARFGPSPLGARSEAVESRAAGLEAAGLVESGPGGLALTAEGRKMHGSVKSQHGGEANTARRFKELFNGLTRDEFLAFVCFSYPEDECAEKESDEYRRLVPMRSDLALSIYRKGSASAQKAAHISGEYYGDFFRRIGNEVRNDGI